MREKSCAPSGDDETPSPIHPNEAAPALPPKSEFRWQSFFQRAREPLFLLSRRRRILFVNRAWEELTGVSLSQARGVACTRRQEADPPWFRALCPPREVLEGRSATVRRVITEGTRRYWDIDFLPLQDADGL